MSKLIYLDYAAATPPADDVLKVMVETSRQLFYNPSSQHAGGLSAHDFLEEKRRQLARLLAVQPTELVFTAGATEANHLALSGFKAAGGGLVACLAIDHDSLKKQADILLAVDPTTALVDLTKLDKLDDRVGLISLAGINSEIGVIQPFRRLKQKLNQLRASRQKRALKRGLYLHIDGSQMPAHHNCQPHSLGADMLTLSGGKMAGPVQSAALFIAKQIKLKPQLAGGDQERGLRPGTQSLANIAGLVTATQTAITNQAKLTRRLLRLQTEFEANLSALGATVVLPQKLRSPHISTAIFPGQDNERLAYQLSQRNIYVGLGSACHAASGQTPASLSALGFSPSQARSSLRFSYGPETTAKQLKRVASVLADLKPGLLD